MLINFDLWDRTVLIVAPETPRSGEDHAKRLGRRRSVDYPRRRPLEGAEQTSPSVYDWLVCFPPSSHTIHAFNSPFLSSS